MEGQLKNQLVKYRDVSLNLKTALSNNNYDILSELMDNRENIIENIETLTYTKEDFNVCCEELDLVKLDEELRIMLNSGLNEVRDEINKLSMHKSARKSYNSKISVDPIYFSKKI